MKKIVLFLIVLGLFVSCDNNTETGKGTVIDPNECYMIQQFNELGAPVDSYICMMFEKNAGHTFEEALNSIKSELDALVERHVNAEKVSGFCDADKWELRQIVRNVKNSPNNKLVFTSIELYMYAMVYDAYILIYQYCVIDSEGNIYHVISPED